MSAPIANSFLRICQRLSRCQFSGKGFSLRRHLSDKVTIQDLKNRGIIDNIFPEDRDELPRLFSTGRRCLYCGFDPTSDSLHIGNLLAIMMLLHCQRAGHDCIALIGEATAHIGDPSGKTKERDVLKAEDVRHNAQSIFRSLERIFANHELFLWKKEKPLPKISIMNNSQWYEEMKVVNFLSVVGRHFRMGTMLGKQSVRSRLESAEGMSFAEFSYQVFQAYDFYYLHKNYDCLVQLGGTDQMGNLMAGYDLIKRTSGREVYGITIPLVTSSSGQKLGKSAGNAVWINADRLSPFDFYQHFVRLPDDEVEKYLRLFTFLPDKEIDSITDKHKKRPEERLGQKTLAEQVTILVHSEKGLDKALRCTEALYSGSPESLNRLSRSEILQLFEGATVNELILEAGMTVLELSIRLKCFKSKARAEKIIREGGFHINNRKITNTDEVILQTLHILDNKMSLIRVGKKNYHIVQWV